MANTKTETVATEEKVVKAKKAAAPKKAAATGEKKAPAAKKTTTAKKPAAKKEVVAEEVKEVKEVKTTKEVAKKTSGNKKAVYTARFKELYQNEIVKNLMTKFNYKSVMQVPSLNKIVVNIGVGDATGNSKLLDDAVRELGEITGQKPVITKAKKSIASFKLREGQSIGCKVTLRGNRMYEFFDKLVSIALPRVRDFRGISKNAFDGRGNYTLGVKEQLIFPEINYDKVSKIRGMDIVIVTTAKTDEEAFTLLSEFGMPFAK